MITQFKGQLARWMERLEEFQFEVIHRNRRAHCTDNADALSCIPGNLNDDMLPTANVALVTIVSGRSQQDSRHIQMKDELVGHIFVLISIKLSLHSLESIKNTYGIS